MADDMFNDLSSESDKANDAQDRQNEFDLINYDEGGEYVNGYGGGEQDNIYFDNTAYVNPQNVEEQIEQPPQFLFQQSNIGFSNRPQSYIEQIEQPNIEVKVDNQIEEELPANVEIKQQNEIFELTYDHINQQEEEAEKDQPIKSQIDMKPVEEPQYVFLQQEFNDVFQAAASVNQISCFPPPYFRNFTTPKAMAPPSLEVIQKNKQYFCLGNKIDFASVYQKPQDLVSSEDRALVSTILTPEKNVYDVMQEVMSSIMNKSIEILKHSSQGGQQLSEYISEMDQLVKKFSILCKLSKIKFAKIETKNIFENEKAVFEKSTEQIHKSISQIKRYKDFLKINEILNSKNPVI